MDELTTHIQENQCILEGKQTELEEETKHYSAGMWSFDIVSFLVEKEVEEAELQLAFLQHSTNMAGWIPFHRIHGVCLSKKTSQATP